MSAPAVLRSVLDRSGKSFEIATFSEPANSEGRAILTGAIELIPGRGRIRVYAFVNDRRDAPGQKFITLTSRQVDEHTGEISFVNVAIGNVVNSRGDGAEVYFDTIIFNPVDRDGRNLPGAQPVSVYVTRDCDLALHARLGFAQPRIDRPRRASQSASEAAEGDVPDLEAQAAIVAAAVDELDVHAGRL